MHVEGGEGEGGGEKILTSVFLIFINSKDDFNMQSM
jgi:hypothetical protein